MTEIWGYLATHDSLPWALLGATIGSILTGLLVPRYFYKEKVREAERWRLAYELERTARSASDKQTSELLESNKTNDAIVAALFDSKTRRKGDPRVASTTSKAD